MDETNGVQAEDNMGESEKSKDEDAHTEEMDYRADLDTTINMRGIPKNILWTSQMPA
jgi:hypothetical protein